MKLQSTIVSLCFLAVVLFALAQAAVSEDEFTTKLDEFVKKHQHGSNETHLKECLSKEWKEIRDKEVHELAKVDAWIEKVAADKCKHDDASKVDSTSEKKPTEAPTEKIETSTHAHNHNDHRQDANKKAANHQPQKSDKSASDKLRFNGFIVLTSVVTVVFTRKLTN